MCMCRYSLFRSLIITKLSLCNFLFVSPFSLSMSLTCKLLFFLSVGKRARHSEEREGNEPWRHTVQTTSKFKNAQSNAAGAMLKVRTCSRGSNGPEKLNDKKIKLIIMALWRLWVIKVGLNKYLHTHTHRHICHVRGMITYSSQSY